MNQEYNIGDLVFNFKRDLYGIVISEAYELTTTLVAYRIFDLVYSEETAWHTYAFEKSTLNPIVWAR